MGFRKIKKISGKQGLTQDLGKCKPNFFVKPMAKVFYLELKTMLRFYLIYFLTWKKYMKKINASISEDKNESMNFYIPWHDL